MRIPSIQRIHRWFIGIQRRDFFQKNRLQLKRFLAALGFFIIFFNYFPTGTWFGLELQINLKSNNKHEVHQLYYDVGKGFKELLSVRKDNHNATEYSDIVFRLPGEEIRKIRLDFTKQKSHITIRSISLKRVFVLTGNGKEIFNWDADAIVKGFTKGGTTGKLYVENGLLHVTSAGNDQYLVLNSSRFHDDFLRNTTSEKWMTFVQLAIQFIISFSLSLLIYKKGFQNEPSDGGATKIINSIFGILIVIVFFWFSFQALYFANNVSYGVSPDEPHHLGLIRLYYAESGIFLENSLKTYRFGSVTTVPYLYHLILGKLVHLNCFGISNLLYLRYINTFLGILFLFFTYLLCRQFTSNNAIIFFTLMIPANLLMFVFLSGMISYDNLINLLSVITLYLFVLYVKHPSAAKLLLLFICMLVGTLTKLTFLPLCLVLVVLLLIDWKTLLLTLHQMKRPNKRVGFLLLIFAGLVLFNSELYLGNIRKYSTITPSNIQVLTDEVVKAHYGPRKYYQWVLDTKENREKMPIKKYFQKYVKYMNNGILGIVGHKVLNKRISNLEVEQFQLVFILFFLLPNFRKLISDKRLLYLLIISSFYSLFVFQHLYRSYLLTYLFNNGMQGRYHFPIIACVSILIAYFFLIRLNDKTKALIIFLFSFKIITNGFFHFYHTVGQRWIN